MTEANVDTLRRGYEALNRGDLTEVMALIDEDLVWDGRAIRLASHRTRQAALDAMRQA